MSYLSYIKDGLLAMAIIALLFIGYHYKSLTDKSEENTQLKAQIVQLNKDVKEQTAKNLAYQNRINKLQAENEKAVENAIQEIDKNDVYRTCRNSNVMLKLLRLNSNSK